MRKVFIGLLACALAACSTSGMVDTAINTGTTILDSTSVPKPVEIADNTILDEKAGVAVEAAYTVWRTSVEIGVDGGLITGAKATWARETDATLYRQVIRVRQAYWAVNAPSYNAAADEARKLIQAAIAQLNS